MASKRGKGTGAAKAAPSSLDRLNNNDDIKAAEALAHASACVGKAFAVICKDNFSMPLGKMSQRDIDAIAQAAVAGWIFKRAEQGSEAGKTADEIAADIVLV